MKRWFFGNKELEQIYLASEIADVMEEVDNELFKLFDNLYEDLDFLLGD